MMKRKLLIVMTFMASLVFAQENDESLAKKDEKKFEYKIEKIWSEKKRPQKVSKDKIIALSSKDEKDDYVKNCQDTFKYGLESDISSLVDELSKNEDLRFVDEIYDLFYETKDPQIRNKILAYFSKLNDPCLSDYVCEVINDPYEENRDTVEACFKYAVDCKVTDTVPGLVDLVDKEEEKYFNGALNALGELGGKNEAQFLAEYLDRDDLSNQQKQSLMKVLGRIKAVETWDKLSEIAQDEDENSFVRMYAAEAIGAMEKEESREILMNLFESSDPNLRCYVIKGLSHFKDEESKKVIIQALRDSQYKVRLEAVNAVEQLEIKESSPYLIYRCKDSSEQQQVKDKAYKVLGKLNTKDGNEYLIGVLKDKKIGDGTKSKVAAVLLENNFTGTDEVIELAREALKSETRKSLRYSLGKEFAKYSRNEFAEICGEYIDSEDVATQGTGLDIWAKGRYKSIRPKVELIAKDAEESEEEKNAEKPKTYQFGLKKKNANAKKAKKILDLTDSLHGKQKEEKVDAVSGADSSAEKTTENSDAK